MKPTKIKINRDNLGFVRFGLYLGRVEICAEKDKELFDKIISYPALDISKDPNDDPQVLITEYEGCDKEECEALNCDGDCEEAPKQEAPKQEAPKQEAPKQEAPKQEAPKQEAPKLNKGKSSKK